MASNKIIYWDVYRSKTTDSSGATEDTPIRIGYQEAPNWEIHFISSAGGTISDIDMTDGIIWEAAIDDDFDSGSEPMARTLNVDIDSSQKANGIIIVGLDAETTTWLASLGTEEKKGAWFRLKGLNSSSKIEFRSQFEIVAENDIDPSGGTPPDPVGDYWTKTEADARYTLVNLATTQVTLTDDDTTSVGLGSATTYRIFEIECTIDDGSYYYDFIARIIHNGTTATMRIISSGGDTDSFDTIDIDADYNSGSPLLKFTVTSHGSSPKLVYSITKRIAVSS